MKTQKEIIETITKGIMENYFNTVQTDINFDEKTKVLKIEVAF